MGAGVFARLMISLAAIAVGFFVYHLLKYNAKRVMRKKSLSESRYFIVRKIMFSSVLVLCLLALVYIWGIDVRNLWVSITGMLTMVAIAFFAVWSLIGNVLAGLLLYFSAPFRIGDTIEVMPDGIKGRVLAINTLFTLLVDDESNYFHIPNSLFFQKYMKVFNREAPDHKPCSTPPS